MSEVPHVADHWARVAPELANEDTRRLGGSRGAAPCAAFSSMCLSLSPTRPLSLSPSPPLSLSPSLPLSLYAVCCSYTACKSVTL